MLALLPGNQRHNRGTQAQSRWLYLTILLLVSVPGRSDAQPDLLKGEARRPVLSSHPMLAASLERISRGSATWRSAIEAVRQTGRVVLVATLHELQNSRHREAFDSIELAEVVPVLNQENEIPLVIVVVDLRLLQRIHEERRSVPRDIDADLDRILVHEVYGHAIPYLLAGNLSGRCADPRSGERGSDACSIRRENAVRVELGLGRRLDGGISSLTLAWSRGF